MSETVLHVRASDTDVQRTIGEFTSALLGRSGAHADLVQGVQLRISTALLSLIQADFEVKSRGGTGVDGITWPPLSRKYLAYGRRFGPGERGALLKAAGARNRGGRRPLLTASQDKEWRKTFAVMKAMLEARGLDSREAAGRAAAIAWAKVKAMGGQTKLDVFGNRQVDILRDTSELYRSFSPGADGNIQRFTAGQVIVGTNKKPWHHRGNRRLPARPFWPVDGRLPSEYWQVILAEARVGVLEAVTMILGRAA